MSLRRSFQMIHIKCRGKFYPCSNNTVQRLQFLDTHVPWNFIWANYNPADYTAAHIYGQTWADPDIADGNFHPKWNMLDGNINRKSHMGDYVTRDLRPMNPIGRTGLRGRGVLGKWGPNHAADPIVTRWKRNGTVVAIHPETKLAILQFVAIQRRDSGEWAIPGGMIDTGEVVTSTLKREFLEEAINSLGREPEDTADSKKVIDLFFEKGNCIYKGYVDDPRNTDNAWMETIALNFHDDSGSIVGGLPLAAGDDAVNVCWMDINSELLLYASHKNFIQDVAKCHNAHW